MPFRHFLLVLFSLCLLAGCQNPNAVQMDLSRGYGEQLKLLHLKEWKSV